MHVVYQPLWRIVLHSLFIDRELVLSYSFKSILNQVDISYQESVLSELSFELGVFSSNWFCLCSNPNQTKSNKYI